MSIQWLVPLVASFGLGDGGVNGFEELAPPIPDFDVDVCGVDLAASFCFLAFCRQSGQVTSLTFAD